MPKSIQTKVTGGDDVNAMFRTLVGNPVKQPLVERQIEGPVIKLNTQDLAFCGIFIRQSSIPLASQRRYTQ